MAQTDYVVRFTGQDNISSTVNKVKQDLTDVGKAGTTALDKINDKFNRIVNSTAPLKRQLRDIQGLMAQLNAKGLSNTDEYTRMAEEAGRLKNAISDAAAATARFSNDTMALQAGIQAFQGIAAAGTIATGVMGLFGTKNDEVQRAILKVQSALAILNGVQQIANTLNKDSVLVLKMKQIMTASNTTVTAANTASNIANTASVVANTSAQKAWNVAKAIGKAMFGDFTGLLILGAGALVTYAAVTGDATEAENEHTKALKKEKEAQETYYSTLRQEISKSVAAYNQLKSEYANLRNEHEKTEWINNNTTAFNNLGVAVNNTADADYIFNSGTNAILNSLKIRAKYAALAAKYQQIYNQALEGVPVAGDKLSQEVIEKEFGKNGGVYYNQNYGGGLFGNGKNGGTITIKGEELLRSRALKQAEENSESILKQMEEYQRQLDNQPKVLRPNAKNKPTSTIKNKGGNNTTTTSGNQNTDTYEKDKLQLQTNYNNKLIDEITYKTQLASLEKSHLDKLLKEGKATQTDVDRYGNALKAQKQLEIELDSRKEITTLQQNLNDGVISQIEYAERYANILEDVYNNNVKMGTVTDDITNNYKDAVKYVEQLKRNEELGNIKRFTPNTSDFDRAIGNVYNPATLEGIKQQMDYNEAIIKQYGAEEEAIKDIVVQQQILAEQAKALKKQQEDYNNSINLVNGYSEAINNSGNMFNNLSGALDESTKQWLNFAGQAANAIATVIPQIQKLIIAKNAEALASGTAEGAKMPFPYNLAAIASIIATIVSVFASLPKFAEGGIVGGASKYGDRVLARVNSGEMILNGKQQRNLFNAINNGDFGNGNTGQNVTFKIKGSDLYGALKNYGKIQSKVGKGFAI